MQTKKDALSPTVSNKNVSNPNLEKFKEIIREKYNQHLESYWDIHKWSIENFSCFWEELWHYFDIVHSKPYDSVYKKTGPGFMDCEWFSGARFNFAENILQIRDDSIAIIYADEYGCEETVTFHQLFEGVKLYAAAFKKHGLRKGDVVACYMSNRKESILAFLAASSIGAIFGGPHPYIKSKAAAKVFNRMEPKFLFAIDHHMEKGTEYHNIDNLSYIADNVISLEKIIIVATKPETYNRDLSDIKKSCFLEDFLCTGRDSDGTVPDLEFEQLPFSHPVCVHFTSGTTGTPKGPVHSAGTLLSLLCGAVLCWNLDKGDVYCSNPPVGWVLWFYAMPCLARGVTLFLYAGSPLYQERDSNIWDMFSKFKVNFAFLTPSQVDTMEKENIVPRLESNLNHFKILAIGGCPPKPQNFLFIRNKIKADVFVHNQLGTTETLCKLSGVDLHSPAIAEEVQVPCLGMDLKCFDEEGLSVVNQMGQLVIATPTPALPVHLWKDGADHSLMKEKYLSRYPGAWWQCDEARINPETGGIVVKGRTDDAITQQSQRFLPIDIYCAIHDMDEIRDSICVAQQRSDGGVRAVLFLKMNSGCSFTEELVQRVERKIADDMWYKCVPEVILEIEDIPYNLNGKKMEGTVREILATNRVPDQVDNVRNPDCLRHYCDIPHILNY